MSGDAIMNSKKRSKISQSELPRITLEKSLIIAQALWDEFAGKGAEPLQIALALHKSPTSGDWRNLCGASIGYGLTEGGCNAKEIVLTPLGKSIVGPIEEGEMNGAIINAVLRPNIAKGFFEKYDRAKLPSDTIAQNVLISMGFPKERVNEAFNIIVENGKYSGIISDTKTGPYVSISAASKMKPTSIVEPIDDTSGTAAKESIEDFARQISAPPEAIVHKEPAEKAQNNKVFVSHGKNKQIVDQLKEIIKFGKYEPVVSVENESLSKPVPDKVLDDMRSCFSGVINVHSEGELLDSQGTSHIKINDNVLIEIGAAMALYGKNYILLVQKGVKLPSNLQGLYRCEYEGEKLDYEATMKLLKTFNQFD